MQKKISYLCRQPLFLFSLVKMLVAFWTQTLLWILVGSRKVFKLLTPIAKGIDREDGVFYLYIVCSDPQQSQ